MQATGDWSNKSIKKIYIFMEKIMSYCQVMLMTKNEFFISYFKACIWKLFTGPVFLDSHLRSAKNAK